MIQEQQEQRKLLEQLLVNSATTTSSKKTHYIEDTEDEFEEAFLKFLNAYSKVQYEDRPQKLRKLIGTMNISETECLSDFIIQSQQQVEDRQSIENSVKLPTLTLSGLLNLDDSDKSSDWDAFELAVSPHSEDI